MVLKATLGSTVLPLRNLAPSQTIPSEPDRILAGAVTLSDREGTYYTEVNSFAGPFGQEWFEMWNRAQGYRSGALIADRSYGYLLLPPGTTPQVSKAVMTTPVTYPSFPGLSARIGTTPQKVQDYYQYVPVGNQIYRSDEGAITFPNGGVNPRGTITGATQITSIVAQLTGTATAGGLYAARLWAAGASASGDLPLYYADHDTGGTSSWTAHGTLKGEALVVMAAGLRGRTRQSNYPDMLVARSEGTMYRVAADFSTVEFQTEVPGRAVFLATIGAPDYAGAWFIKGGVLHRYTYALAASATGGGLEEIHPDLPHLSIGTIGNGTPWVSDRWNVFRVFPDGLQWVGLPANFSAYREIVSLTATEGWLLAVVNDAAAMTTPGTGVTTVLGLPLTEFGAAYWPSDIFVPHYSSDQPPTSLPYVAGAPSPADPWTLWQPIVSVSNQTGYGLYSGLEKTRQTALRHGFLLTYDATNSFVHSFELPAPTGGLPPGGIFAQTATRLMPSFDGGMPGEAGSFFGVALLYDFPTGVHASAYIKVEYSVDNGGTWTQIGSNIAPGGAARSTAKLSLASAVQFTVLDIRLTIDAGATRQTVSPRIFGMAYIWAKRGAMRYTFALIVDAGEYLNQNGGDYSDLLNTIATLYDTTTPLTLSVDFWANTYSVRIDRVIINPDETLRPDAVRDITLLCEEVI
jgi:hypothetical protein